MRSHPPLVRLSPSPVLQPAPRHGVWDRVRLALAVSAVRANRHRWADPIPRSLLRALQNLVPLRRLGAWHRQERAAWWTQWKHVPDDVSAYSVGTLTQSDVDTQGMYGFTGGDRPYPFPSGVAESLGWVEALSYRVRARSLMWTLGTEGIRANRHPEALRRLLLRPVIVWPRTVFPSAEFGANHDTGMTALLVAWIQDPVLQKDPELLARWKPRIEQLQLWFDIGFELLRNLTSALHDAPVFPADLPALVAGLEALATWPELAPTAHAGSGSFGMGVAPVIRKVGGRLSPEALGALMMSQSEEVREAVMASLTAGRERPVEQATVAATSAAAPAPSAKAQPVIAGRRDSGDRRAPARTTSC